MISVEDSIAAHVNSGSDDIWLHPRLRDLHRQVTDLQLSSRWAETIVRALIDYEGLRSLECQMPTCLQPTRVITRSTGRRDPNGLSIDHIKMEHEGGMHHLRNLRIVHYRCNCAWLTGRKRDPEVGRKIGQKLRGQTRTQAQRDRISVARRANTSIPASCPVCDRQCKGTYGLSQHLAKSPCGKENDGRLA